LTPTTPEPVIRDMGKFKARSPALVLIWSFGLFVLMHTTQYLGIWVASQMSGASFDAIISGDYSDHLTVLGTGLIAAVIGIPVIFVIVKYLWRRGSGWMCLGFDYRMLVRGIAIGFFLPALVVAILGLMGVASVRWYPGRFSAIEIGAILVGNLGLTLFTGVAEETVFRGMAARELAARWGWPLAAMISGVYFGLVHVLSRLPQLDIVAALWLISFATAVGLVFVAMLVRSHSLWLPIGFHAGWNFCLAAVFGADMGGGTSGPGLLDTELSGPAMMTGGDFGPELSVVSLLVYLLAAAWFLRYSRIGPGSLLDSRPECSGSEQNALLE
jgi:membrane protease YdiL (CAAX protease family)